MPLTILVDNFSDSVHRVRLLWAKLFRGLFNPEFGVVFGIDLTSMLALYDGLSYAQFMKVTALIPDDLVNEVRMMSHAKTTTEAIVIVMKEWLSSKRLRALNQKTQESPLLFGEGFSAEKVRALNRQST